MKRCRICDIMYDDTNSFSFFLDSSEDTCRVCEEVILDALAEFEEDEEGEDTVQGG